jgi:hypothetical protein
MKSFVILTGPQAVGKMSVGLELKEHHDYKLFHNHMSIEMVVDVYGELNRENKPLVNEMRDLFFKWTIKQDVQKFVFTFTWAFNHEDDHKYVHDLVKRFEDEGYNVTIVELEASLEERLSRNKTEQRLAHKPTKRNLEWSENDIKRSMDKYRLNSNEDEITHENYLRINNEKLTAKEVADQINTYISSL